MKVLVLISILLKRRSSLSYATHKTSYIDWSQQMDQKAGHSEATSRSTRIEIDRLVWTPCYIEDSGHQKPKFGP